MLARPEDRIPADALVFFGATGDLAHRMIFPALYSLEKRHKLKVPVIGVANSGWNIEALREWAADGITRYGGGIDDADAFERLSQSLSYVDGDYDDRRTFADLRRMLATTDAQHPVMYLAIPPGLFPTVVEGLADADCTRGARVLVEKPFGRDLASALELSDVLHGVFKETDVMRIDHYLGKEAVQGLLFFRFANSFLEPIWNRNYIAGVQVSLAEDFGVEGRGQFYDEVGCLRDVVQNHLLQVVALLAMEPPCGVGPHALREERAKVLRSLQDLRPADVVRGQFVGYRDEPGVEPDSDTETYLAARCHLESWRWEGVPFCLRAGKRLPTTCTEVLVEFKAPPQQVFGDSWTSPDPGGYVRFRLSPRVEIAMGAWTKAPGDGYVGEPVELQISSNDPSTRLPYERLLRAALSGDEALFACADEVEDAWRAIDPVLHHHRAAIPYAPGTWGPTEADSLVADLRGWRAPILPY